MDGCYIVEREVNKVLSSFNSVSEHASQALSNLIIHVEKLNAKLNDGE